MDDGLGQADALSHAFRIPVNAVVASTAQANQFEDLRNARAPALLACGDRHAAPMRLAARGALAREAHDAAIAHQRLDPGDAELDRLLDHPVHLVGLGKPMDKPHAHARFHVDIAPCADLDIDAVLLDALDGRVVFAAAAVEDRDRIARLEAQRLADVLGGLRRERELRSGTEAQVAVDARRRHGTPQATSART